MDLKYMPIFMLPVILMSYKLSICSCEVVGCQAVIKESSGSCQAVIRQLTGSCQEAEVVDRQSFES